jgi:hypothetical protein
MQFFGNCAHRVLVEGRLRTQLPHLASQRQTLRLSVPGQSPRSFQPRWQNRVEHPHRKP